MRFCVAALALILSGCTGTVYELDQKYAPLTRIREAELPGLKDGMVATIYTEIVVKDLSGLLAARPPGSVEFEALLLHERVHAVREFADPSFFFRYATSSSFRWSEEKAAYAVELAFLKSRGRWVDEEWLSSVLSENYSGMVSKQEAKAWIESQR